MLVNRSRHSRIKHPWLQSGFMKWAFALRFKPWRLTAERVPNRLAGFRFELASRALFRIHDTDPDGNIIFDFPDL